MKTKLTALALLSGLIMSPYFVYANESQKFSTESAFVTADADRSGNIDSTEFDRFLEKAEGSHFKRTHQDFSMMDLNKNSTLTLEEFQVGEEIYPLAFR